MSNTKITIIIPVFRLDEQLKLCLQSIEKHIADEYELIIVLDGISDQINFFDQFHILSPTIITLEANKGPAYARNIGAQEASGDILFFLDSDVTIHATTLFELKSHFFNPEASDAVIGSYDDSPSDLSIISRFRNLFHHYTHQHFTAKVSTFWGACGAVKRDVFFDVGGFDTSFDKPSIEDIELGYRLKKSGYSINLNKRLLVKHLKKWSFVNMIKTDVFYRAKPWTKQLLHSKKVGEKNLNLNSHEKIAVLLLYFSIMFLGIGFIYDLWFLLFALISSALLIFIKRETYFFFLKYFSSAKIPIIILLHWCYLISASVGFLLGLIEFRLLDNSANRADSKGWD